MGLCVVSSSGVVLLLCLLYTIQSEGKLSSFRRDDEDPSRLASDADASSQLKEVPVGEDPSPGAESHPMRVLRAAVGAGGDNDLPAVDEDGGAPSRKKDDRVKEAKPLKRKNDEATSEKGKGKKSVQRPHKKIKKNSSTGTRKKKAGHNKKSNSRKLTKHKPSEKQQKRKKKQKKQVNKSTRKQDKQSESRDTQLKRQRPLKKPNRQNQKQKQKSSQNKLKTIAERKGNGRTKGLKKKLKKKGKNRNKTQSQAEKKTNSIKKQKMEKYREQRKDEGTETKKGKKAKKSDKQKGRKEMKGLKDKKGKQNNKQKIEKQRDKKKKQHTRKDGKGKKKTRKEKTKEDLDEKHQGKRKKSKAEKNKLRHRENKNKNKQTKKDGVRVKPTKEKKPKGGAKVKPSKEKKPKDGAKVKPSKEKKPNKGGAEMEPRKKKKPTKEKPKRKPKKSCSNKKKCSKFRGKCKKQQWINKNPGRCKNYLLRACKYKGPDPDNACKCCLKSTKCKQSYRNKKCVEAGGRTTLIKKCKTGNKVDKWSLGVLCTCCLPACPVNKRCKLKGGQCLKSCKYGVIKKVKCKRKGCKCCKRKPPKPETTTPQVVTTTPQVVTTTPQVVTTTPQVVTTTPQVVTTTPQVVTTTPQVVTTTPEIKTTIDNGTTTVQTTTPQITNTTVNETTVVSTDQTTTQITNTTGNGTTVVSTNQTTTQITNTTGNGTTNASTIQTTTPQITNTTGNETTLVSTVQTTTPQSTNTTGNGTTVVSTNQTTTQITNTTGNGTTVASTVQTTPITNTTGNGTTVASTVQTTTPITNTTGNETTVVSTVQTNTTQTNATSTTETTTLASTTTATTSRTVLQAMKELLREMAKLGSEQKESQATDISISAVEEIKPKLVRWSIDRSRLSQADIPTIQNTTSQVIALVKLVQEGQATISSKAVITLESISSTIINLIGLILKDVETEEKSQQLALKKEIITSLNTTIQAISKTMDDLKAAISPPGKSTGSTTAVIQISKIMTDIVKFGSGAMTQGAFTTLTTLSKELTVVLSQAQSGAVVFGVADVALVDQAVQDISAGSAIVTPVQREIDNRETTFQQLMILEDLATATSIVKENIGFIVSKMATATSTEAATHTITQSLIDLIISLQESYQTVTKKQILEIKAFESEAETILNLLDNKKVKIFGLETLKASNQKLQEKVDVAIEEDISRMSVSDKGEILKDILYYTRTIIETIEENKNKTATGVNVTTIQIFLSSLSTVKLTFNVVSQLETYSEKLASLPESSDPTETDGFVDLLAVALKQESSLNKKLEKYLEKEEQILITERLERVTELTLTVQKSIKLLTKKVVSGSTSDFNTKNIEKVIVTLLTLMTDLNSKTFDVTDKIIEDLQDASSLFSQEILSIKENLPSVTGLGELATITERTLKILQKKENVLTLATENKEKIEVLEEAIDVLEAIETYVNENLLSEGGPSEEGKKDIVITELQVQLSLWKSSIETITMSSIDIVWGFYESIKDISPEDNVAGLDALISQVITIKNSIQSLLLETEGAESDDDKAFRVEKTLTLVSESKMLLLELKEKTQKATQQVSSTELDEIISISMIIIEMKTEITETELTQLESAVRNLTLLVAMYEEGTKTEGLIRLQEALSKVEKGEGVLEREVDVNDEANETAEALTTAKGIVTEIGELLALLSPAQPEAQIKNDLIDDIVKYLVDLRELVSSVSEETIENLSVLKEEIQRIVFFTEETTEVSGFEFTIEIAIQETTKTINSLAASLGEENELVKLSNSETLAENAVFYVEQIIATLTEMKALDTTEPSAEFVSSTKTTLEGIAKNASIVTSTKELEQIWITLVNIFDSGKKVEGTEELLDTAGAALEATEVRLSQVRIESMKLFSIRKLRGITQVTSLIANDLEAVISGLQPEQLLGSDYDEFTELISYLNMVSASVDSITQEDITDIKNIFVIALSLAEDMSPDESIGNLVVARVAASRAFHTAAYRLRQQQGRQQLQEDIEGIETILSLLVEIEQVTSSKIKAISNIITGTSVNPVIKNLIESVKKFSSLSFTEVTAEDLSISLQKLKAIEVTAEGIPGIFQLHTLTKEAITVITTEKVALEIAVKSRERTDVLSTAVSLLSVLQAELDSLYSIFGQRETSANTTSIFVLDDLKDALQDITTGEDVSYVTVGVLQDILSELYLVYARDNIDISVVASVKKQCEVTIVTTERALFEHMRLSNDRTAIDVYRRMSALLSNAEKTLVAFIDKIGTASGEESRNENITSLADLLEDIQNSLEVTEEQVQSLEALVAAVEVITVQAGQGIMDLERAASVAGMARKEVSEEVLVIQATNERSVMQTTMEQATMILERIAAIAMQIISSIGLAKTEEENSVVADINGILQVILKEPFTIETLSKLEVMPTLLESVKVTAGVSIKGLKEVNAMAVTMVGELESLILIFKEIIEVKESLKIMKGSQALMASLRMELVSISSTGTPSALILELSDIITEDTVLLTDEAFTRTEEIVEILKVTGSTITSGGAALKELIDVITVVEKRKQESIDLLESELEKLLLTHTLLETKTVLREVADVTQQIIDVVGEETGSSVERNIVSTFITYLKKFQANVVEVDRESLRFFKDNLSELQLILNNKESIKGIEEVASLSKSVLILATAEINIISKDLKTEDQIMSLMKSLEILPAALSVFKNISLAVGEPAENAKEVSIPELDEALSFLMLIKMGTATVAEVEQLEESINQLQLKVSTLSKGTNIINLQAALTITLELQVSLEEILTEVSFEARSSWNSYAQKQIMSLLYETTVILETIMEKEGTGESLFFDPVFEEILISTEESERETSLAFILSFAQRVDMLKEFVTNITINTMVEGLSILVQKTKSSRVTLSHSVARAYAIELEAAKVHLLEDIEKELMNMEQKLADIAAKAASQPSGSSLKVMEFTEILAFMKENRTLEREDVELLREYTQVLITLEAALQNGQVEELDTVASAVKDKKSFISMMLIEARASLRKEQQVIYASACGEAARSGYASLNSFASIPKSPEITEVTEVTEFNFMLQKIDILSVNVLEIHEISKHVEIILNAIASTTKTIAYLPSVLQQLALLSYEATKLIEMQRSLDDDRITMMALEDSDEIIKATKSTLLDIQKSIGALSSQTNYQEAEKVTETYNFLMSFITDFRLIPDDFSSQLEAFGLSSVTATKGRGITYLSEVISLIEKYTMMAEEMAGRVQITKSIFIAKDILSLTSRLLRTLEGFLSGKSDVDGMGSSAPDADINETRKEASKLLVEITMIAAEWPSGMMNFEEEPMHFIALLTHFLGMGKEMSSDTISVEILTGAADSLSHALVRMTESIHLMESSRALQKSFSLGHEVTGLLMSLQSSAAVFANAGKVEEDTLATLNSVQSLLQGFTSLYFISTEHLVTLRTYAYELSVATTSTGDTNFDVTEFISTINSTMENVQKAFNPQQVFVAASQTIISDSSSGDEYMDMKAISRAAHEFYIFSESHQLMMMMADVLTELQKKASSDSSSHELGEEDELATILTDISLILRISEPSLDNLQFSFLSSLGTFVHELQMVKNDNEAVLNVTLIEETITYVNYMIPRVNGAAESLSMYGEQSRRVLTFQATSLGVLNMLHRFQNFTELMGSEADVENQPDEATMEDIDIIADFLIHWSLLSSSITEESFAIFRSTSMALETFEPSSGMYIPGFHIKKHFLVESEVTLMDLLDQSVIKAAIVEAQSHGDLYRSKRAMRVLLNYTQMVDDLSASLSGKKELNSTSGERLLTILKETMAVVHHWASGMIEQYEVTTLEQYLGELPQLAVILEGYAAPPELTDVMGSLMAATEGVKQALIQSETEIEENEADAVIDSQYNYFSQLHYFIMGQISMSETPSKNITIPEVDYIVDAFDRFFLHPMTIDLEMVLPNVSSLMKAVQDVQEDVLIVHIRELSTLVEDIVGLLEATKHAGVYERAGKTALTMMRALNPFEIRKPSTSLKLVPDIMQLHVFVMKLRHSLYTMSRMDIRELSRMTLLLKRAVRDFGHDITYLVSIEETLAFISFTSTKYVHQAMYGYTLERAARIIHEASEDIEASLSTLKMMMMEIGPVTKTEYQQDDSITAAFHSLLNFTSDLRLLPRDFRSYLLSFNLSTIQLTTGTGIRYLEEVYHLMKDLDRMHEQVPRSSKFLSLADATARAREAVDSVVITLKSFIIPEKNGTDIGDSDHSQEEMDLAEILVHIQNITDKLYSNGSIIREREMKELTSYSKMLQMISIDEEAERKDLNETVHRLSGVAYQLGMLAGGLESAFHMSDAHTRLIDLSDMSSMIESSFERLAVNKGTSETESLITAIMGYYHTFASGFSYITNEDVDACRRLVYELSGSSTSQGDTTVDKELLSVASTVNDDLAEKRGIVSAQVHHYRSVLSMMRDNFNVDDVSMEFALSMAAEQWDALLEVHGLLMDLASNLTSLTGSGSGKPTNDTILLNIYASLQVEQFNDLSILPLRLGEYIVRLQTLKEDGVTFNITEVQNLAEVVEDSRMVFNITRERLEKLGTAGTRVLILEDAAYLLHHTASETRRWIDIIEGNATTTSMASTVSSTTTMPTTTVAYDLDEKNSTIFNQASDFLMFWSFDSEAVDGRSVEAFRVILEDLQDTFMPHEGERFSGLYMWEHRLLGLNRTLMKLLEEIGEEWREVASLEKAIERYTEASIALEEYKDVLADSNGEVPSNGNGAGEDNGDDDEDEDSKAWVMRRASEIVEFSLATLTRWVSLLDLQRFEVQELGANSHELMELNLTSEGLLVGQKAEDLRMHVRESLSDTHEALDALHMYSSSLQNKTRNVMSTIFFQELKHLAEHSLDLLTSINITMNDLVSSSTVPSTSTSVTSTTTTNSISTSPTTSPITSTTTSTGGSSTSGSSTSSSSNSGSSNSGSSTSGSSNSGSSTTTFSTTTSSTTTPTTTISSSTTPTTTIPPSTTPTTTISGTTTTSPSSTTGNCTQFENSLLCVAENLLMALQKARNDTSSGEASVQDFEYDAVRMKVYSFSRALREVDPHGTLEDIDETAAVLEDVVKIVDTYIQELESERMKIIFNDVSHFYIPPNGTSI